jgi:chromosome segregation ATPase
MKLRRLLSLSPPEEDRLAELGPPPEDPDWDLLSELDRLRSANSGLTAEAERQTQIGQDYARAVSEQRFRAEELERENAIAHTNCQFLERRVAQAEERAIELDELVEALRSQRDRLQTYYEQQKERADRAEAAAAAMREAAGEVLGANDRHVHALVGTRGLARAKVEYADALDKLRRSLQANAGKDYLSADAAADVRRYFTIEDLTPEQQAQLRESILRVLGPEQVSRRS